jgi:flagellar biosynthesis/type III secretory pathway protein FliH
MKRYHTKNAEGNGLDVMWESTSGYWVLHAEAQAEIDKVRAEVGTRNGLKQANEEGYNEGYTDGQADKGPVIVKPNFTDKHVERLLNELYHERARLERVVKDAVELCQTAIQLEETERDDSEYVLGLLQQFVDTHEGE